MRIPESIIQAAEWGFEPTEFDEYDVEMEDIDEGILIEYPSLVFMSEMSE